MSSIEKDCLLSVPWRVQCVDGTRYILKGQFGEAGYELLFSDLSTIWQERLSADDVLLRSKTLNPNIEVPLMVLLSTLRENVTNDVSNSLYTLTPPHFHTITPSPSHTLTLSLSTTLASLPFCWEFNLSPAPPQTLTVQLVNPLLSMVGELTARGVELVKQLSAKDREIKDYKENGAQVSRKYLETAQFVDEVFVSSLMSTSSDCLSVFNEPSVQTLYTELTRARAEDTTSKHSVSDSSDPSETSGVVTSPLTSPVKKPTPPPSKEDEAARRRELEKKLESDKQKPKKKKRKLM